MISTPHDNLTNWFGGNITKNKDFTISTEGGCWCDTDGYTKDAYKFINQEEHLNLFNAILSLQFTPGCENIVAELTAKLEKQFEIAEVKGNMKKLYGLSYRADGLIKATNTNKQILASSWGDTELSTKKKKTVLEQSKKDIFRKNLNILAKQYTVHMGITPLFIQQLRIMNNCRACKGWHTDNFAKKLQNIDAILQTKPEERHIFNDIYNGLTSLDYLLKCILKYTDDYLDKPAFEHITKIISSGEISYDNIHSVFHDYKLTYCKEFTTLLKRFERCHDTTIPAIDKLNDWDILHILKETYETMYANEYMRPVYEKLGLVITDYHPFF